jgi:hypothetical protein
LIISAIGLQTGKLEIKHVFKGNYTKGDVVSYERTGGYAPVIQYEKGELPESLAKRKALRQKSIDFIFFLKYNLKRNPFDSSLKGGIQNEKTYISLTLDATGVHSRYYDAQEKTIEAYSSPDSYLLKK